MKYGQRKRFTLKKRQSAVKNANINTKTKDVPSPIPIKKEPQFT
jgi:hypothetical protein